MTMPATTITAEGQSPESMAGETLWRGAFKRLRRNPMAIIGASIMAVFVLVAVFAPLLAPYEPASTQWTELSTYNYVQQQRRAPARHRPLGLGHADPADLRRSPVTRHRCRLHADRAGRRRGPGSAGGGLGGRVDTVVMRFVDILLSIPSLLLAISIAAAMGTTGFALMIAIGAAQIPIFARLLRASMLSQSRSDYVLAAGALGLKRKTIVMGHVLPNSLGPTLVQATLNLATAIIEVAALSYLGLGNDEAAVAEWGRMIVSGQDRFEIAPWLAFYPGIAIAITALGFTLLGEAMREVLDPKQRR